LVIETDNGTSAHVRCLTLESGKGGECGFYAANLYARSIFGEDALANLSIEKAQVSPSASDNQLLVFCVRNVVFFPIATLFSCSIHISWLKHTKKE
jgi:hypothetical protein